MKTRGLLLILLLLGLLSPVPEAWADAERTSPDCRSNPACVSLFEQAQQQSRASNLPEALRIYKQAYGVVPDPALLFSIGRVLHKQGQTRAAMTYYRRFLDSGIDDEEQKQIAREFLAALEQTAPSRRATTASPPAMRPSLSAVLPTRPSEKPVYKTWWLWTIAGVVVAGSVGLGLGLGLTPAPHQTPMWQTR